LKEVYSVRVVFEGLGEFPQYKNPTKIQHNAKEQQVTKKDPLEPFLIFAEQMANTAGEILRRYYSKALIYSTKADLSPVTEADKEVESTLRAIIRAGFPTHGIVGEEFGNHQPDAEYVWVLDPIDGTKSFMIGRPLFGTLISLVHKKVPVIGIIDQPILGERWTGIRGYSTYLRNTPIHTRSGVGLKNAVFCTTSPDLFDEDDFEAFARLQSEVQYTIYGGDCYSYGLLARGTVDVVMESGLKPYDFLALRPVVEGAGGVISDWNGQPITMNSDGRILATGSPELHSAVLSLINGRPWVVGK
jgi:inositol-phosphate phosphatase / L-galactose 1-phosphate phosphatase / histidinol-phosphatase